MRTNTLTKVLILNSLNIKQLKQLPKITNMAFGIRRPVMGRGKNLRRKRNLQLRPTRHRSLNHLTIVRTAQMEWLKRAKQESATHPVRLTTIERLIIPAIVRFKNA